MKSRSLGCRATPWGGRQPLGGLRRCRPPRDRPDAPAARFEPAPWRPPSAPLAALPTPSPLAACVLIYPFCSSLFVISLPPFPFPLFFLLPCQPARSDAWLALLRMDFPEDVLKKVLARMHDLVIPSLINPLLLAGGAAGRGRAGQGRGHAGQSVVQGAAGQGRRPCSGGACLRGCSHSRSWGQWTLCKPAPSRCLPRRLPTVPLNLEPPRPTH